MRIAIILILAALMAMNASAQETEKSPWVCVPTQQYGWVCGRGENVPDPRHLPNAPRETPEPLPGYTPPRQKTAQALLPEVVEGVLTEEGEPQTEDTEAEPAVTPPAAANEDAPPAEEQPPVDTTEARELEPAAGPRYGIQLTAMRNKGSLGDFILEHDLQPLDTYKRTWRDEGGIWYVLLTGKFSTVGQATRALKALPVELQQAGAWVRRVDELDNL